MKRMIHSIVVSIFLYCASQTLAIAQQYPLMIDEFLGISILPHSTGDISPFLNDWITRGSVSFTIKHNPLSAPVGTVNIVSLAELSVNSTGEIIASSNRNIFTRFYPRTFTTGMETFLFDTPKLNFMESGPTEGALVFQSPYTPLTRLPGGSNSLRLTVTLWEYQPGQGLIRQLSDPYTQNVTLPRSEDDLALTVTVNERSPYFSDWALNPNSATITIENRWQRAMDVYMETRITDATGIMVETNPGVGRRLPPIRIPATPTFTLNARDIPFFSPSLTPGERDGFFHFRNDVDTYRRVGRFPEGRDYRLCIQLRNYVSDIIHGEYRCSDPFRIDNPPAPELVNPDDGSTSPRTLVFQWLHDLNSQISMTTRYRIQIKEVPATGDVSPDIFNRFDATSDVQQENIIGLSHSIPTPNPRLVAGHRYAWRIQAYTSTGTAPAIRFQNDGWSNVWTFYYESTPSIAAPILESPENDAMIPLPTTLQWSDVRLSDGNPARYWIHIREVPQGTVAPDVFNQPHAAIRHFVVRHS